MGIQSSKIHKSTRERILFPISFLVAGIFTVSVITLVAENLKKGRINAEISQADDSGNRLESESIAANFNLEPADIEQLDENTSVIDDNGGVLSAESEPVATADEVAYSYTPQTVCSKKNITMEVCQDETEDNPGGVCITDGAQVVATRVTTPIEYFAGLDDRDLTPAQRYYKKIGAIVPSGGIASETKQVSALHTLSGGGNVENLEQLQKSESPTKARKTAEEYNLALANLEGGLLMNILLEVNEVLGKGFFTFNPNTNSNPNSTAIINKLTSNRLGEYQAPGRTIEARQEAVDECEVLDTTVTPLIEVTDKSVTKVSMPEPTRLPFFGRLFTSAARATECARNPESEACNVSLLTAIKVDAPWGSSYQADVGQASTIRYDNFRAIIQAPESPALVVPGVEPAANNPLAAGKYVKTACKVRIVDNTKLVGSSITADIPCLWEVSAMMAYCERQAAQNSPDLNVDCDRWLEIAVLEVQKYY